MTNAICDTLLQLLVLTPLVFIARQGNGKLKIGVIIVAAIIFIATSVATDLLSHISLFQGQQWNWVGKIVSLLLALAFIFVTKQYTPREFGLTTKVELNGAKPIMLICAVYFLLRLFLYLAGTKEANTFHIETILFQATLPGLEEEVVFRGILLTLLNSAFVKAKWTFANVSFGWAAIFTSILFGLTHGISFDNNFHFQFDAFSILRTAFDGFLFTLLIEKTKSLIPSILFHNILNLIGNH